MLLLKEFSIYIKCVVTFQAAFLCVVWDFYTTHFLLREIWRKGEAVHAIRNCAIKNINDFRKDWYLMKKKILAMFMILSLCLANAIPVVFAKDITVTLNGNKISFDVPPQIVSDRTMVPMRAIFEAFGYDVSWQQSTQKITAKGSLGTITMQINNYYINKNSDSVYTDVAPLIIDERTLVPLRAISELLDCSVDWNGSTQTVTIETSSSKDNSSSKSSVSIEDMTPIGDGLVGNSSSYLEDNYGNKYSNYIFSGGNHNNFSYETLLGEQYSRFTCTIYTLKGCSWSGSTKFIINADGKKIYTSTNMTKTSKPVKVDIDISGCNDFEIEIEGGTGIARVGDGIFYK